MISCNEQAFQAESEESGVGTQEIRAQEILPFQYIIQAVGFPENLSFRLQVSESEVVVEMLNESGIIHSSTIPLKMEDLQKALSILRASDLEPAHTTNINMPAKGVIESLESSLGNRTFYRDEKTSDQLLPTSAASFQALSDLAVSWTEIASQEFKEDLIARITKEQEIIHKIGDFVEIGMTREIVSRKFPDPDWETGTMMNYVDWRPDLVSNAWRKGTYGITLRLADGKITSWTWTSK